MLLKNKTILVTGGGKGIGYSTVLELISEGAFVYTIIKSRKDLIKFKSIKNIKVYVGDVVDKKLFNKIFIDSIKSKRVISGLVNNAGIRQRIKFEKISDKELKKIFEINFFSIFQIMQKFSLYLKKQKKNGSIVNLGSIVGKLGFSELCGYASTKTALVGLTKSFAVEMAKYNIRANLVSPGFIKSSYYKKFKSKKKLYNWTKSRIPMSRWGNPEEVSSLITFLLSDKSKYINGEEINIDGGWTNS